MRPVTKGWWSPYEPMGSMQPWVGKPQCQTSSRYSGGKDQSSNQLLISGHSHDHEKPKKRLPALHLKAIYDKVDSQNASCFSCQTIFYYYIPVIPIPTNRNNTI